MDGDTNVSISTRHPAMFPDSTDAHVHDHGIMTADSDSMAVAKHMHWVSSVIIGIICMIIGLIGNTLSMIIWRRKSVRSSTGNYLTALAAADTGLLVFFFLVDALVMINPSIKQSYSFGVFFSYIGYPIFFFFVVVSIWLTVGVTVDRYIQVCWITAAKDFCNEKRAITGIVIILILAFIINLPHFNTYYPVVTNDNSTADAFAFTQFGAGEGSRNYEFWVHCMVLVLVPFGAILILNLLIIRQVIKINKNMEDKKSLEAKSKTKKQEHQMTRLLLLVTFTFLVLIALQCVTQCFFMLKPKDMDFRLISEAFSIAKLGIIINSSINFFLYCVSGKRFRKELCNFLAEVCCLGAFSSQRRLFDSSITGSSKETSTSGMVSQSSKL